MDAAREERDVADSVTAAHRPLPFHDTSVDALPSSTRMAIGEVWLGRAQSELKVGAQFGLIAEQFAREPVSPDVRALLEGAMADERRHSTICRAVAERYSGTIRELSPSGVGPLVRFGTATDSVSLLLHLVLLSCVNEVTSTFYLRECMQRARSPLARAALRELLADDIQHARVGWIHLASDSVTSEDRAHVALALPTLLRLSQPGWTNVPERPEPWFVDHGCAGSATASRAFEDAVREVILPGMSSVRVDSAPAARWAEEQLSRAV